MRSSSSVVQVDTSSFSWTSLKERFETLLAAERPWTHCGGSDFSPLASPGLELVGAPARPSSCLTRRHVPQKAAVTSSPSQAPLSPKSKAGWQAGDAESGPVNVHVLSDWRRTFFYACGLGGGGGLTCKSFHVSTGGATSYIRLDPFLSFVLLSFCCSPQRLSGSQAVVSVCSSTWAARSRTEKKPE